MVWVMFWEFSKRGERIESRVRFRDRFSFKDGTRGVIGLDFLLSVLFVKIFWKYFNGYF